LVLVVLMMHQRCMDERMQDIAALLNLFARKRNKNSSPFYFTAVKNSV